MHVCEETEEKNEIRSVLKEKMKVQFYFIEEYLQ